MSLGRVLVVAPSPDLRKSLAFALEAEGYVVTTHAGILGNDASRGYDAVVFDHKAAAAGPRKQVVDFCRSAQPLVLLAGSPQLWLAREAYSVVPTPLMGDALSNAVAAAVAHTAQRAATSP